MHFHIQLPCKHSSPTPRFLVQISPSRPALFLNVSIKQAKFVLGISKHMTFLYRRVMLNMHLHFHRNLEDNPPRHTTRIYNKSQDFNKRNYSIGVERLQRALLYFYEPSFGNINFSASQMRDVSNNNSFLWLWPNKKRIYCRRCVLRILYDSSCTEFE